MLCTISPVKRTFHFTCATEDNKMVLDKRPFSAVLPACQGLHAPAWCTIHWWKQTQTDGHRSSLCRGLAREVPDHQDPHGQGPDRQDHDGRLLTVRPHTDKPLFVRGLSVRGLAVKSLTAKILTSRPLTVRLVTSPLAVACRSRLVPPLLTGPSSTLFSDPFPTVLSRNSPLQSSLQ